MATVQSIIDKVVLINKDPDYVRWSVAELQKWVNDAQDQIASLDNRSAAQYVTLTLAAGSRQDLRTISSGTRWLRFYELVCNVNGSAPTGRTIRRISRPALDNAFNTWRGEAATATVVKEYATDDREPYTFDVNPPVATGTKVYALCAVKPAALTALSGSGGVFGLADGYEIPAVDYVLYRCFMKDANDPTYAARAVAHFQAFQLSMGIETKDAGVQ